MHKAAKPEKPSTKITKGEKTAQRILDVAEIEFAQKGFKGTNLREIAQQVDINQPGLYRHFKNKEALYQAVLERALGPMLSLLQANTEACGIKFNSDEQLVVIMEQVFDMLSAHPHISFLFQQAMMSDAKTNRETKLWLDALLEQGQLLVINKGNALNIKDPDAAVLKLIALYNLCVGYFSSASIIENFLTKKAIDPELLKKQKILLKELAKVLINAL